MKFWKLALLSTLIVSQSAFAADPLCTGRIGDSGDFVVNTESGGMPRTYRLHVPASYDPTTRNPIVLAWHGWGDNAANFEEWTELSLTADDEGFIVAYPQGVDNSFNGGMCCGTANHTEVDDVGFARDIVEQVAATWCVDPDRVYSTGFSNGAIMSHRLGCEAADLFAAIAPASGFIGVTDCAPVRPIPVIQTQGTVDATVPYWTGKRSNDQWAATNECGSYATIYKQGATTCIAYNDCAQGATVEWCEIRGMPHTWPSTDSNPGWIDANELFWNFFAAHPMP
jgi:polyhydroxybutyrate depolymerase